MVDADAPGDDDELIDVIDPGTGEIVDTQPRSVVHAQGLWHAVFHCLVARGDEPPRVLLQRRKRTARAFPGMLDVSVAGHLTHGETPLDGVREIAEELGIDVDPSTLVSLGRRSYADETGEGMNREIAHVYLLVDDTSLDRLQLDAAEVGGFAEVSVDQLEAMLADPTTPFDLDEVGTDRVVHTTTCTGAELVPSIDGYWIALADAARAHVRGLIAP